MIDSFVKTKRQHKGYLIVYEHIIMTEKKEEKDPCWKNYEQVGMKSKNGEKVPNCVPKKTKAKKK